MPPDSLDTLRKATDALALAEQRTAARRVERDALVVDALLAGHAVAVVARVTGMTRTGVRKIRDAGVARLSGELTLINEQTQGMTDTGERQRLTERRTELQLALAQLTTTGSDR